MQDPRLVPVIAALTVALVLAIVASHPRLRALRARLGVTILLSAGLPFLVMGALFGHPQVGILTPEVLADLRPAVEFALGWIGFSVGMLFEVRRIDRLPKGLGTALAAESLIPAALTGLTGALVLFLLGAPGDRGLVREALVLAACGAPSAMAGLAQVARRVGARGAEMVRELTRLDDVTALVALGWVAVLFRPEGTDTRWVLPPSAWVLATLGLGGVLGIVAYVLVRKAGTEAEEVALLIGTVALSAGASGYLSLSVPVVCAMAGALIANLPMRDLAGLRKVLRDVERPLYLILLLMVGVWWQPLEWRGWVMAVGFVAARIGGKALGVVLAARRRHELFPNRRGMWLSLMPQSPISIVAIVASATFFRGALPAPVQWAMSGVIVGSVLTEAIARLLEHVQPPAGEPGACATRETA